MWGWNLISLLCGLAIWQGGLDIGAICCIDMAWLRTWSCEKAVHGDLVILALLLLHLVEPLWTHNHAGELFISKILKWSWALQRPLEDLEHWECWEEIRPSRNWLELQGLAGAPEIVCGVDTPKFWIDPPASWIISPRPSSSFNSDPNRLKHTSFKREKSDLQDGVIYLWFCWHLFVKMSHISLDTKKSDLQDDVIYLWFCWHLFVKKSCVSLDTKKSDLQDGVIYLLFSWHFFVKMSHISLDTKISWRW